MSNLKFKEVGGVGMLVKEKKGWKVLQIIVGSIGGALAVYGFALLCSFI